MSLRVLPAKPACVPSVLWQVLHIAWLPAAPSAADALPVTYSWPLPAQAAASAASEMITCFIAASRVGPHTVRGIGGVVTRVAKSSRASSSRPLAGALQPPHQRLEQVR